MYETMQQIKDANEAAGDNFFDPNRMHVFWTVIHDDVINGNMFITSEQQTLSSQRLFTIRRVFANGLIETVGSFQEYEFHEAARDAARLLGGGDGAEGGGG